MTAMCICGSPMTPIRKTFEDGTIAAEWWCTTQGWDYFRHESAVFRALCDYVHRGVVPPRMEEPPIDPEALAPLVWNPNDAWCG